MQLVPESVAKSLAPHPSLFHNSNRQPLGVVNKHNACGRYQFLLAARRLVGAYLFGRRYAGFIPQKCVDALRLYLIEEKGIDIDAIEKHYALKSSGLSRDMIEC